MREYLPQILIGLGLILTFIGGFVDFRRSNKLSAKNAQLMEKNVELTNQLMDKSKELNSIVTGGNSICYVSISNNLIMLINNGDYSVYSISFNLVDLDELKAMQTPSLESLTKNSFSIQELPGGTALHAGNISIKSNSIALNYNIQFTTRNSSYVQLLRLRKVNSSWVSATRAVDFKSNQTLFEKIDEDFPLNDIYDSDWHNSTKKE